MEYLCKKSGNDFSELIYIICITLQITRSPIKNVYQNKGVKMLALKDKNRFLIQRTAVHVDSLSSTSYRSEIMQFIPSDVHSCIYKVENNQNVNSVL
jgi:hypothetical protein